MLKQRILQLSIVSFFAIIILSGCAPSSSQQTQTSQLRDELKPFTSCDDLTDYLLATLQQERKLIDYVEVTPVATPDRTVDSNSMQGTEVVVNAAVDASAEIVNYSGTNNQVSGVDEADFVKTVGDYSYILSGGYLLIFDSWPAAQSHELSRLKLEGLPLAMFVKDDMLWVVSQLYQKDWLVKPLRFDVRSRQMTRVNLIDLSDRKNPEILRTTSFEGRYVDARRIGNRVHMVTAAQLDLYAFIDAVGGIDIEKLLPMLEDQKISDGSVIKNDELISECGHIYRPAIANGTGTVTLTSFDLADPFADLPRQSIIGNSGLVYANKDHLYIASMEDNFWRWLPVVQGDAEYPLPATTIHKFQLSDNPGYLASGRVDGYLINQFAMDEQDDQLRVVTTTDAWWEDKPPRNSLFILQQTGQELKLRSRLDDLGKPGERLFAARFMGDLGFLVTFEQIDPLYTLDLSDADHPRVAGTLEVPGVSTFLQSLGDGLLLAVGRNADQSAINLSLFDTSIIDRPVLLHQQEIGTGSYSEAEYNHKALTWFAAEKMLALPVTHWRQVAADNSGIASFDVFNGLQMYRVDREKGFEFFGSIDHSVFYRNDKADNWFYPAPVRRSFFIRDSEQNSYLYSISTRGMKVNALDDLEIDLAALPLPEYDWNNIILY